MCRIDFRSALWLLVTGLGACVFSLAGCGSKAPEAKAPPMKATDGKGKSGPVADNRRT
jgi:predicted small lipoprotein YifL